MAIEIRDALMTDIPQLINVIQITHDELVDKRRLAQLIDLKSESNHKLLIAHSAGEITGFIDGFMTIGAGGEHRWELDLLGVLPAFQNKGIGRQLVQQFLGYGVSKYPVAVCRALVAVDNAPMQRIMQLTGFECDDQSYSLMIAKPNSQDNWICDYYYIPVRTCLYDGIWLEGDISTDYSESTNNPGDQLDYDLIGTLVALNDMPSIRKLRNRKFNAVGQYHWWTQKHA